MKKNWLEWTVFAASLALVGVTLGFLLYDTAKRGNEPPDLEVHLGAPERRSRQFVVPVSIANHGDRAAKDVRVAVVVWSEGVERERSELVFDFVPRGARLEGFAVFETDPGGAQDLSGRVVGYQEP